MPASSTTCGPPGRGRGGPAPRASRRAPRGPGRARSRGASGADPPGPSSSSGGQLAGEARRARVTARRAGRPGTRRRGRACRSVSIEPRHRAARASASPDGVAPGIDRAELRADVQVDAARPQRAVRAAAAPRWPSAISVSVIPNLEPPAPTARPGCVSGATSGLSRYRTSMRGAARSAGHRGERVRLLGRFDRDPAERPPSARGAGRGPEVGVGLADRPRA